MPNDKPDFTVSLERERKRIRELEDLLILIRDRWDCSREVEAMIDTVFQQQTTT